MWSCLRMVRYQIVREVRLGDWVIRFIPNPERNHCSWVERYGRHGPCVIYRRRLRDLFTKSYWVYCWGCPKKWGPFPDKGFALVMSEAIDILTPYGAP